MDEYAEWVLREAQRPLRERMRRELCGKRLACHCIGRGLACHGEVVAAIANSTDLQLDALIGQLCPAEPQP